MAKLVELNSLILPPDYKELRRPEINRRNKGRGPLEAFDLMQFDERTVLYDVFFNGDGSRLYAIGPPFSNLGKYLKNLLLTVNGGETKFRLQILPRKLICLEAQLTCPIKEINTVNISFEDCDWSRDIPFCRVKKTIPLALTTIQKDNQIHWILDWIRYYEKAFGVDQFIIYDNFSEYQAQLIDVLPDNILVVPWNYPYGPTDSTVNKFLHTGQINHSRLRFEEVDTFLNFDIDELLVVHDERVKTFIKKFATVRFEGYVVPYIVVKKKRFSFSDFTKRMSLPKKGAKKYSFKRKSISANTVHKVIIDGITARVFRSLFFKEIPVNQGYFLHYSAINTDWKAKTSRPGRRSHFQPWDDVENLVSDYSVRNVLDEN
jgi:hypothetical protein